MHSSPMGELSLPVLLNACPLANENTVHDIDPLAMNDQENALLFQQLIKKRKEKYYLRGHYDILREKDHESAQLKYFNLTRTLIFYRCEAKPKEHRYAILFEDQKIEVLVKKNTSIHFATGVLKPTAQGVFKIKDRSNSHIFIKEIKVENKINFIEAKRNYYFGAMLGLYAKPVTRYQDSAFIFMRYLSSRNAKTIIPKEPAQKDTLTLEQRLQYTCDVIWSLLLLQTYDILHGDVKPQNMMVVDECISTIRLIDFDFSRILSNEIIKKTGFTPVYIAPEMIEDKMLTKHRDSFSLGIILLQLWGFQIEVFSQKQHRNFHEQIRAETYDVGEPAAWIDAPDEYKEILKKHLRQMIAYQPEMRGELNEHLAIFETMLFFAQARNINKLLIPHYEYNTRKGVFFAIGMLKISIEHLRAFSEEIKEILKTLYDEPGAIKYFIRALRVEHFQGMTTRDQLINEFSRIMENWVDLDNEFQILGMRKNYMLNNYAERYHKEINSIFSETIDYAKNKMKKYFIECNSSSLGDNQVISLDHLVEVNKKYYKEIARAKDKIKLFEEKSQLSKRASSVLPNKKRKRTSSSEKQPVLPTGLGFFGANLVRKRHNLESEFKQNTKQSSDVSYAL